MALQTVITLPQKQDPRADIIDEFGELERKIAHFKPVLTRHAELKKAIGEWYRSLPGGQTATEHGRNYTLQVGMAENRRTITDVKRAFNALKRILGIELVFGLITIPLKAVDAHVPIAEHRLFLKQERTGPREITAVLNEPVEAAQAA